MRFLCLNHNVAYSGTYFRTFHLSRQLARRGHQVTLVTTGRTARLRARAVSLDGIELIEAPDLLWGAARTGWDPWNTWRRIGLLHERDYDVVHAFDSRPAVILPALTVVRRTGAALFMDWADWWGRGGTIQERSNWPVRTLFGPIETWFEESFRTRAVGSTVTSAALKRRLNELGVPEERILELPHACDPELEPLDRGEARARLSLEPTLPLVAHLGVLTSGDAQLLYDAFRRVYARLPRARLALIGKASRRLPADLVAAGAVIRTGRVSDEALRLWLSAADVCVVALRDTIASRGRWPSRINDYFSIGRPTVITRVGDAAALVEREGAGWVAAPEPDSFAAAILAALADAEAGRRAGARARALAESRLSWHEIGRQLEQFYERILERRQA